MNWYMYMKYWRLCVDPIYTQSSKYLFLHTCTGAGNTESYLHQTNFTRTTLNLRSMDHFGIVQEP